MEKNFWTKAEMDIIESHYPYMEVKHLQKMLPGRSLRAIYAKAQNIGVTAYTRTTAYLEYLHLNLGRKSYKEMAEELGCSKSTISYRTRTLRAIL